MHAQTHSLELYDTNNSPLLDDNIRAIATGPDSSLWIGTESGLSMLKNGNWSTIDTLLGYQIRALAFDVSGHAWVGTFLGGLWIETDTGWVNHTAANSLLPDDYVRAIAFCPNGDTWVGTVGGAAHISNGTWTIYRNANTNWIVEHIASAYCSPTNEIWLGGLNTGLMHQLDTTWAIYRSTNSNIPDNTILDIKGNTNGDLLLAMPAAGVAMFDGNLGWVVYNTQSSYNPSNSINRIAIGNDGNIYFASVDKGLVVYKGGFDWFNISSTQNPDTNSTFLPSNEILTIVQDHNGDIWASMANNGLVHIQFIDTTVSDIRSVSLAQVSIHPNPAQEFVLIDAHTTGLSITVTDVLGSSVFATETTAPQTKIPLGYLPKGIYMVIIQSGGAVTTQRLIKN